MAKLQESYIFQGMQRDLSVSKHPSQFVYDGLNIRFTAVEGDTLLSITNEKGPQDTGIVVDGQLIGYCCLNQYLVLFTRRVITLTHKVFNNITRIDLSALNNAPVLLYSGDLGFSHPIEAIASFENVDIQKVYWTDGVNPPRVINIADGADNVPYNDSSFDFIPSLDLEEEVYISKILGGGGTFAPGVIQYAFTYFRKNGQETNIFYTSPLLYISYTDRGASPEDKVDNVFNITITNLSSYFDYVRIYSIQRTSLDSTPIVKRVQDISIKGQNTVTFTDTGTSGSDVDPTELLYKGGESITAQTLEQKDNTLFLGNLTLTRKEIKDLVVEADIEEGTEAIYLKDSIDIESGLRTIYTQEIDVNSSYPYASQLNAFVPNADYGNLCTPCAGFKRDNIYRLGVQFQYKTGKWSNPVFIKDALQERSPMDMGNQTDMHNYHRFDLPCFTANLTSDASEALIKMGYKKVRPVVVFPEEKDKIVICQGVACPTMKTDNNATEKHLHAQSSWFFRPSKLENFVLSTGAVYPVSRGTLPYAKRDITGNSMYNPVIENIRRVEIQGDYDPNNKFQIEDSIFTLHTPEAELGENLANIDFTNTAYKCVGYTPIFKTLSDIEIQTETPQISSTGGGIVHKSFTCDKSYGIVSGLFYDDFAVNDDHENLSAWKSQKSSAKWLVYLWNKDGSLNNDINRPADKGTPSAVLKKKVISNLRVFSGTSYAGDAGEEQKSFDTVPQLFNSDQLSVVKLGDKVYMGNIDTILSPDFTDGMYFAVGGDTSTTDATDRMQKKDISTDFNTDVKWKTFSKDNGEEASEEGFYKLIQQAGGTWSWNRKGDAPGEDYLDLVMKKDIVRMKYKSSPHLVCALNSSDTLEARTDSLYVVEIRKEGITPYGSENEETLREHTWLPCGEPVLLSEEVEGTSFQYSYGDTYFQRYDCLKTYPFTKEDKNQVVEIGSFMLETYINIDGRYDRNRGQLNNLNMSPVNFNLLNPVYSQKDNFFSYKIMPEDYYKVSGFPNQITWSKEKQAGGDTDLWTNVTLSSVYDMDGSKGSISSINTWKDNIYCFQDKGIGIILFNSRVQIPTSDGLPIEITNNYKVDGYRYLSDGVGCNNKRLIKETPYGIYFIDSIGGHLFHLSDDIKDLAAQCNMTTWFKDHSSEIVRLVYDDVHQDVYLVRGNDTALCFSEKLGQFTGFYSYTDIDFIESYNKKVFTMGPSVHIAGKELYTMFEGEYGYFFGTHAPWSLTFISNGIGNNLTGTDKTFTNLEFRASVEGDGEVNDQTGAFSPTLPFDSLEVWNEYQHGTALLQDKNGHSAYQHHLFSDTTATLKRKFRIWRCDIPRNNASIDKDSNLPNCFRKIRKPLDRMRNPWLYVQLQKNASESMQRTEIHDLVLAYFS